MGVVAVRIRLTAAARREAQEQRQHAAPIKRIKSAPMPLPPLVPVEIVEWHGCYSEGWKGQIVDGAFAHPAKASRAFLTRIYDHLFTIGAISKGSVIVDPFSGIGTTSIIGAWRGCQVIGCELEKKFHDLALENVELHRRGWETMQRPIPVLLHGDSRRLRDVVREAACVVSSPPYATDQMGGGGEKHDKVIDAMKAGYGETSGQLGSLKEGSIEAVVASPPYSGNVKADYLMSDDGMTRSRDERRGFRQGAGSFRGSESAYGSSDGQLGVMKDTNDIAAVISSPAYADIAAGAGGLNTSPAKDGQQGGRSPESASQQADQRYGESAGQLAQMVKGEVDSVVTSPPYAESVNAQSHGIDWTKMGVATGNRKRGEDTQHGKTLREQLSYGETSGQLGAMKAEDVSAILTSPPYMEAQSGGTNIWNYAEKAHKRTFTDKSRNCGYITHGDAEGQLSAMKKDDTFWEASLKIVRECHAILRPGGHAAWIVKSFVRGGKIVNFPNDWRRLCEHCGFETLTEIHAMLVQEDTQTDLWGEAVTTKKERKSFFRRLHEKKSPDTAIDYEVVFIMKKCDA